MRASSSPSQSLKKRRFSVWYPGSAVSRGDNVVCKAKCGWTATALAGAPTSTQNPAFDPKFDAHMKGEISSKGALTGCHSLYGVKKDERLFEQGAVGPQEDKGEGTRDHKVFAPATNDKIYSAKVRLKIKDDARGKPVFSDEKLSCFWPDDMCLECVKDAIVLAWKNHKGVMSGRDQTSVDAVLAVIGSMKWAGQVNITKGKSSFSTWVGSPQTGGDSSKISTAFPKVGGKFF